MKKLLAFAAALSLASTINVVLPTTASADQGIGNDTTKFCQAGVAAFLGVSVGNCIQLVNSGGGNDANGICHLWMGPDEAAFFPFPFPFASFSDCVTFFNTGSVH